MTNKGSWSLPSKSFFSSTFSNIHLLFLQQGCSAAHESAFFNHPSVQEISQLQFPFPAIWNWNQRQRQQHASMDPTSCQREKLLFEFKKGFYFSFCKCTVGAPECLSNISIYLLCKSYKKACYMKHLPFH